ncbi:hypothetical protein O181_104225 [Austropuccinia psidii MF-1]|uniref:Integrase catalytic domain-containing protein n=1 Tax=Austropuccinia psidii MF-1 TaxID=1389203 RepID=A0A9Q3JJH4_9BASI|nr:hypothetical protein [Austropuccinia psidii MF-1]
MIKIKEPRRPWEIVPMDWITGLPPGGDISYNAFLVIVDRFSKSSIVLPCHKDDTAMDTALLIWNRVVSWTGIFTNIINDRDPKFTSALWTNIQQLSATNLSFFTAYHPQTDGLAEKMIQTLEDMVRRICAYGLEFKDCDGFIHDWCTLLPELKLAYKTAEIFPVRNKVPQAIPPIESSGIKKITKVLKERQLRTNKVREYLVRYSDPACEDEWLAEKDIPEATKFLRRI